jgi:hypothetical protein
MFLHFERTGDLAAFLDILPKPLFKKSETFKEDLSVFFFDSTNESEKRLIRNLAKKLEAKIYEGDP